MVIHALVIYDPGTCHDERPRIMKRILTILTLIATLFAPVLRADSGPVVVELYTSQGCSSCPPADRLLQQLAKRDDVIALALHVDYWDYLGWKDPFANAAYSKRQRAFANHAGRKMVYTPQMIVNGREHVIGTHADKVDDLIRSHQGKQSGIKIETRRDRNNVHITVSADRPLQGGADLQLVRYLPERVTEIRAGENRGRTITYVNIVNDWQVVRRWSGAGVLEFSMPVDDENPSVLLVQKAGPGQILAAAHLR